LLSSGAIVELKQITIVLRYTISTKCCQILHYLALLSRKIWTNRYFMWYAIGNTDREWEGKNWIWIL